MLEPAGSAALLSIDPELGRGLTDEERDAALNTLRVPLLRLVAKTAAGKWGRAGPDLAGFLIAEGALLREVTTASSATGEILGPGDLIRPFEEDGEEDLPVRAEVRWKILAPVRLATIDGRVLAYAARWPPVLAALVGRAIGRTQRLATSQSISHMVRVRDRLLLLFWHLSETWGHVGVEGVTLELSLTHSQLALLVGAERPSVSAALSQLADDGLLTRTESGRWVLKGPVPDDVASLLAGRARAQLRRSSAS